MSEIFEYCDECRRPLEGGEVYYMAGLHYCVNCRGIAGASLGI